MSMFKLNVTECMLKCYVDDYNKIKDEFKQLLREKSLWWVKGWARFGMFGSEGVWMNYKTKELIRIRWAGKMCIIYQSKSDMFKEFLEFYSRVEKVEEFSSPNTDYEELYGIQAENQICSMMKH